MSLPAGTVGSFNAMENLQGERKAQYSDIGSLLMPEELAEEAAKRTWS